MLPILGMEFVHSLEKLISTPQTLTLLMAPPAWGKTSILLKLRENWEGHLIYISPLRALANEFSSRMSTEGKVFFPRSKRELQEGEDNFFRKKKGLLVATAEVLDENFFEKIKHSDTQTTFIFDELHLFLCWGDSFRPWLEEILYLAINTGTSVLGLTATLEKKYLKRLKSDFLLGLDKIFIIDVGNGQLLNKPQKILNYRLRGRKKFIKRMRSEVLAKKNEKSTYLVFCQYRREVQFWISWAKRSKVSAIGCVGGEVDLFQLELKTNPEPDVIFCTTTLSHGVNLPNISKIFLTYPIERKDFWIQMVGRGGRSGEHYSLYHMEKCQNFPKLINSFWQSLFDDVLFFVRIFIGELWKPKLKV